MALYVVAYDIADDRRRERLSVILGALGPRVQKSVFEVELPTRTGVRDLRRRIREVVDPQEDQVRIYPIGPEASRSTIIIGARTLEERAAFWLVR